MENLEQKKRRLFGKKHLPKYLEELNRLVRYEVKESDLLSIVDTDNFIESSKILDKNSLIFQKTILFSEKEKLLDLIKENTLEMNAPYLMYLSYSLDCGLMRLSSLYDFNFNFSFYDEHAGIIIFTREDKKEKILLDYSEDNNKEIIEIEVYRKP